MNGIGAEAARVALAKRVEAEGVVHEQANGVEIFLIFGNRPLHETWKGELSLNRGVALAVIELLPKIDGGPPAERIRIAVEPFDFLIGGGLKGCLETAISNNQTTGVRSPNSGLGVLHPDPRD